MINIEVAMLGIAGGGRGTGEGSRSTLIVLTMLCFRMSETSKNKLMEKINVIYSFEIK